MGDEKTRSNFPPFLISRLGPSPPYPPCPKFSNGQGRGKILFMGWGYTGRYCIFWDFLYAMGAFQIFFKTNNCSFPTPCDTPQYFMFRHKIFFLISMMWYEFWFFFLIFLLFWFICSFFSFSRSYQVSSYTPLITNFYLTLPLYFLILIFSSFFNIIFWENNFFLPPFNLFNFIKWNTFDTTPLLLNNVNLGALNVYLFPFIYIFILITIISFLFCLSYNKNELNSFVFLIIMVFIAGLLLFATDSFIFFFFAYELLLIPSFLILYFYAKSRRCVEAAFLMFFWTQFGALCLLFSFFYIFIISSENLFSRIALFSFSSFDLNFLVCLWLVGFGVKLPLWPFCGWLPKAHVEASTNFSIFLSGVLVKFAFFGFFRCLVSLQLEPTFPALLPFLLVGLIDSTFKLFFQMDLKKLVAYATVVEMHWLTFSILSGYSPLLLSGLCMLLNHALLSSNAFLIVDAIGRRFKTRLISELGGINFLCPKLFLIALGNCLLFLGFPGSLSFVSEFLFFLFLFDFSPLLFSILLVFIYLLGPSFFFRSWINLLFSYPSLLIKTIPADLFKVELLVLGFLFFLSFWLGLTWQVFLV